MHSVQVYLRVLPGIENLHVRAVREGCTLVVLELSIWSSSDVVVVSVISSCNLAFQRLLEHMNKNAESNGKQGNKSIICVRMR